jgi:NitT/TauT family transport system permease protein
MAKSDVMTPPAGTAVDAATSTAIAVSSPPPVVTSRSARERVRRHRMAVNAGRLAVLLVVLGGWELSTRTKLVDPFFYGQPSKVITQIHTWISHGTSQGSLWQQINVTLEEAALGFVIGVVNGVVFGVALGRIRFLAEILGPYIKIMNSIPRIVLGSIFIVAFGLGLTSKVLLAVVLVFFGVFFNAFQASVRSTVT